MNSMEQEQFIKLYGAPLEWAPDDWFIKHPEIQL